MAFKTTVVKFIRKGDPGNGIASELDYYKATATKAAPAWANNGTWTLNATPSDFSASKPYLWKVHITNYTEGNQSVGDPILEGYWGQDGAQGSRGIYVPTPRLWDEYPSGYQFQAGGDGDERLDIVLFSNGTTLFAYSCMRTHTKSTLYKPGNTTYWESGQQWTFIATAVLLATRGRIENLTVDDLMIVSAAGELLAQMDKNRIFIQGEIQAGKSTGKHVKLNPDNQTVEIYDANGALCTTLDGKVYNALTDVLPAASASTISGVQASASINSASAASKEDYFCSAVTLNGGVLSVTIGAFTLTGSAVSSGTNGLAMTSQATVFATLKRGGVVIQRQALVSIDAANASSRAHASKSYKFALPSGSASYQLFLEIQGTNISASAAISSPTISHSIDSFLSTFFANGFALTQSTTNYLVAMALSKVMRLYLGSSDGSGLYINSVKQPFTVFAARITDTGSSPSITTFIGNTGTVSRPSASSKKDGYSVNFSVAGMGITSADKLHVIATGMGIVQEAQTGEGLCKATVRSVTLSGTTATVKVAISDDETANFGSFYIEVKAC